MSKVLFTFADKRFFPINNPAVFFAFADNKIPIIQFGIDNTGIFNVIIKPSRKRCRKKTFNIFAYKRFFFIPSGIVRIHTAALFIQSCKGLIRADKRSSRTYGTVVNLCQQKSSCFHISVITERTTGNIFHNQYPIGNVLSM